MRQYAAEGWTALAGARDPDRADALARVRGDVRPLRMDVTDLEAVRAAAAAEAGPLDLLINGAGIMGEVGDGVGRVDYRAWAEVLDVNVMGAVRVLDAFAGRLAAARGTAVTITSGMGSLADVGSGAALAYRTSKAAVNMAMRARAFDLRAGGDGGGETSVVAPFEYAAIVTALLAGYLLFDEAPTLTMLGGAALIIAAGLIIIWRERKLGIERVKARGAATPQG